MAPNSSSAAPSHARRAGLPTLVAGVLELIAPTRCLGCRARSALPWCVPCHAQVRPAPPGCARCAAPRGGGHACWPADAPLDATTAAFDYRGPVAASVVTAKLAGARAGWPALADLLAQRIGATGSEADVVTWVTTPPSRTRKRGGDHAEVLARAVAMALDRPCQRLLDARADADGIDRYTARTALPGTNVLLVDDVVTTGATAWRAAAELRRVGAGWIELAVLARAGTHPLGVARRTLTS